MGGDAGHRALLTVLLWTPFLGGLAGDGAEDGRDGFRGRAAAANDLLSQLGRAAWETLENWVGPQSLRLVAEVRSRHRGARSWGGGRHPRCPHPAPWGRDTA